MDLSTYIQKSGKAVAQFAQEVGVKRGYLYEIMRGDKKPSLDVAFRIEEATGGKVPAESFREQ